MSDDHNKLIDYTEAVLKALDTDNWPASKINRVAEPMGTVNKSESDIPFIEIFGDTVESDPEAGTNERPGHIFHVAVYMYFDYDAHKEDKGRALVAFKEKISRKFDGLPQVYAEGLMSWNTEVSRGTEAHIPDGWDVGLAALSIKYHVM